VARAYRAASLATFSRVLGTGMMRPRSLENRVFGWACRRNLARVKDLELRRKLTPSDPVLCRRPIMSTSFYEAVQRPGVQVVDGGVRDVWPGGVVTTDGVRHELDVLVLATGFRSHDYMRPMSITGEDGVTLEDSWANGPTSYGTVAIPGFPNMFMILGPNVPVTHVGLHDSMELQAGYVSDVVQHLRREGLVAVSPSPEAAERFTRRLRAGFAGTTWQMCNSWYVDSKGTPVLWPFSRREWIAHLQHPDLAAYRINRRQPADDPAPPAAATGQA
jgi:cation diffusion facilitator CzcD-associated flavoprotein CzcO